MLVFGSVYFYGFPFSHNHGSGTSPNFFGNYCWRDPFSTMIMGGRKKSIVHCYGNKGIQNKKNKPPQGKHNNQNSLEIWMRKKIHYSSAQRSHDFFCITTKDGHLRRTSTVSPAVVFWNAILVLVKGEETLLMPQDRIDILDQENGPGLKMYFLFEDGDIPASYVSLPGGKRNREKQSEVHRVLGTNLRKT